MSGHKTACLPKYTVSFLRCPSSPRSASQGGAEWGKQRRERGRQKWSQREEGSESYSQASQRLRDASMTSPGCLSRLATAQPTRRPRLNSRRPGSLGAAGHSRRDMVLIRCWQLRTPQECAGMFLLPGLGNSPSTCLLSLPNLTVY